MSEGVNIRILDREFTIGCPPEERESLQSAAQLLDARMRGIRGDNKMAAFDRISFMLRAGEFLLVRRIRQSIV